MPDQSLSQRIYLYLQKRDDWVTRAKLEQIAGRKGFNRFQIKQAFDKLSNNELFPDVGSLHQDKGNRKATVPGHTGEVYRVWSMNDKEKEVIVHALSNF